MKLRRILLKPGAQPVLGGFLARVDTYCDGHLVNHSVGNDVFDMAGAAAFFAETQAENILGELAWHYGDRYTFEIFRTPDEAVPEFLIREYRRRNPNAFN